MSEENDNVVELNPPPTIKALLGELGISADVHNDGDHVRVVIAEESAARLMEILEHAAIEERSLSRIFDRVLHPNEPVPEGIEIDEDDEA